MSMIFYPIFLSVYGQLFYHVPVRIIAPNLYTFLCIEMGFRVSPWAGRPLITFESFA